ncbi:MAG: hypothetical protein GY812_10515 [Actinomycetia bacterium]|nr:hypothetical protein [Actinomycetes bacterium]
MSSSGISEPTGADGPSELEELRLRVAAQDRLIEAMVDENADIHELRRRNHQLEQYVGKLLTLPGVQAALKVRRKVLRRPEPAEG